VDKRAFYLYRANLRYRHYRVLLPTRVTRHDSSGRWPVRRSVEDLADHGGEDAVTWVGGRKRGGDRHDRPRGRCDLREDHADEHLVVSKRRDLSGHRLEMMQPQRAGWPFGEHDLVIRLRVQLCSNLFRPC
jgi:hypothetical protein